MDASISLRDSQREQETKRVALMETNGRTVQQQQHSVFIRSLSLALSLLYVYMYSILFLPSFLLFYFFRL